MMLENALNFDNVINDVKQDLKQNLNANEEAEDFLYDMQEQHNNDFAKHALDALNGFKSDDYYDGALGCICYLKDSGVDIEDIDLHNPTLIASLVYGERYDDIFNYLLSVNKLNQYSKLTVIDIIRMIRSTKKVTEFDMMKWRNAQRSDFSEDN